MDRDRDASIGRLGEPRRSFGEKLLAALVGGLSLLGPVGAAVAFLLAPLRRGSSVEDDSWILLNPSVDSLPEDGTPHPVSVLTERVDAWNRHPREPIGTVWLRRHGDGTVTAHSSICPHLGCAVEYRAARRDFFCPCHNSAFELTGKRTNSIPPRDMDALDVRLDAGRIFVRYEKFQGGIADKIPLS